MSEYDDRQPKKPEPSPGQVQEPPKKAQEEQREMWRGLKDHLRKFFERTDGQRRDPPR